MHIRRLSRAGRLVVTGSALSALGSLALPATAEIELPTSVDEAPEGPGTQRPPDEPGEGRVHAGSDLSVQIGTGFVDTYGFGIGGRYGYTLSNGIYLGAQGTYYWGNSVTTASGKEESAHAGFIGGEVGYKFFPERHWEIRPYVFGGPAFIRTVQAEPFLSESKFRIAVQPGVLAGYHFGPAFATVEGRLYVTPSPTAFTLLGGAGLAF